MNNLSFIQFIDVGNNQHTINMSHVLEIYCNRTNDEEEYYIKLNQVGCIEISFNTYVHITKAIQTITIVCNVG